MIPVVTLLYPFSTMYIHEVSGKKKFIRLVIVETNIIYNHLYNMGIPDY